MPCSVAGLHFFFCFFYKFSRIMPITNNVANQHREETCIAITSERKCFHPGNSFVKRSLRPFEWQVSHIKGTIHVPRLGNERLLNEAAALAYVR